MKNNRKTQENNKSRRGYKERERERGKESRATPVAVQQFLFESVCAIIKTAKIEFNRKMLAMSTLMMPAPTMACAPPIAVGPHKPPGEQPNRMKSTILAKHQVVRQHFESNQTQIPVPNRLQSGAAIT